jgi:hypothetical protein
MSNLSYFEKHSRNTVSINVLNSIRKKIIYNQELSSSNIELLNKLNEYFVGVISLEDFLTFHFRDSGSVKEIVPMELFMEINKVITSPKERKAISNLLEMITTGKEIKDKAYYQALIEKLMDSIDLQTQNLEKSNGVVLGSMGF